MGQSPFPRAQSPCPGHRPRTSPTPARRPSPSPAAHALSCLEETPHVPQRSPPKLPEQLPSVMGKAPKPKVGVRTGRGHRRCWAPAGGAWGSPQQRWAMTPSLGHTCAAMPCDGEDIQRRGELGGGWQALLGGGGPAGCLKALQVVVFKRGRGAGRGLTAPHPSRCTAGLAPPGQGPQATRGRRGAGGAGGQGRRGGGREPAARCASTEDSPRRFPAGAAQPPCLAHGQRHVLPAGEEGQGRRRRRPSAGCRSAGGEGACPLFDGA